MFGHSRIVKGSECVADAVTLQELAVRIEDGGEEEEVCDGLHGICHGVGSKGACKRRARTNQEATQLARSRRQEALPPPLSLSRSPVV